MPSWPYSRCCSWLQSGSPARSRKSSKTKGTFDLESTSRRRGGGSVDLEIIGPPDMDAVELPPGQADHPVLAPAFTLFDDRKRRENADKGNMEAGEQGSILFHLGTQHDVIDNEIVALGRESRNGAPHAAQRASRDLTRPDGDRGCAGFTFVLKPEAV